MRIIHLTGPIGSGKTTLDMCLRNELGALNIKSETARVDDVLFIGRIHKKNIKNTKNPYIKFGGLDNYLGKYKHSMDALISEIGTNEKTGANYCVMAGIRGGIKKDLAKFSNHEFHEIISLRSANRVLKQREKRRGYLGNSQELANISKEINYYHNEIDRWKNLEKQYSNVHLTVFNKTMLFTDRMKYITALLDKPTKISGYYKRKF